MRPKGGRAEKAPEVRKTGSLDLFILICSRAIRKITGNYFIHGSYVSQLPNRHDLKIATAAENIAKTI